MTTPAPHSVLERIKRWGRFQCDDQCQENFEIRGGGFSQCMRPAGHPGVCVTGDDMSGERSSYIALAAEHEFAPERVPTGCYKVVRGIGRSIATYKTLRQARRVASGVPTYVKAADYPPGPPGIVLLFDPSLLPMVGADDIIPEIDDPDEEQFAERQSILWAQRADLIRKARLASGK